MKKSTSGKKWLIGILLVIVIAGIVYGLFAFGIISFHSSKENAFLSEIPDTWGVKKDDIEFHENGNVIYKPNENTIKADDTNTVIYYDNLIIAYLSEDLNETEARELAESIDGVLVGYVKGAVNTVQIATNGLSYEELKNKANMLRNESRVSYATYEAPIPMDFSDYWNGESDLGNESNPSGSDWWAEAIHAYSAWDYEYLTNPVCIGIIDNGYDVDHEDFIRDGYSVISMKNTNSEENHGTHVAGVICAQPNTIGIKGIANEANVMCIDAMEVNNKSLNLLEFSSLIEWYNDMIETASEKGVPVVINNSWGNVVSDKKDDFWGEYFGFKASDEEIKERYKNSFRESAYQCIWIIYSLLNHGYSDFIFVESAGNGYNNSGPGYDISNELGANFCGISELTFSEMKNLEVISPLEGYSFQDIIDHVVIVAAYENKYSNGSNRFTSFSNYGDTVTIAAPGKDIYSTVLDSKYDLDSGTSMSAPIVTGSLAFLWSFDYSLSAGDVKDILVNHNGGKTAVGVTGLDSGRLYPALDIGASVNYLIEKENLISDDLPEQDTGESDSSDEHQHEDFAYEPLDFSIIGSWKSVGSTGFGQAQPGTIVTFDGTNCNFYSPNDTYRLYRSGEDIYLECTSMIFSETLKFKVLVMDDENIQIHYGSTITDLRRVYESGEADINLSDFQIEGTWKSVGDDGFGQAQPGATVVFDGTHCNFYSPYDTYNFYYEDGKWMLSCKNVLWQDVLTFTVEIIDNDNINIYYGSSKKTVLKR